MKKIFILTSVITAFMVTSPVLAEKVLSADEVKALFTDVTFDGRNELKGKNFQMYFSESGAAIQKKGNGSTREGEWSVDGDGRHCVEFNRLSCAHVTDMGDGIYHKYPNGVHSHTLQNFRKGNDL